ncbi:hypothetical protein C2S52_006478 [Perilla frutescens var. hirtella]|nr:hypothetical protein C2S52_006478 [Perilla frutescens var. hirtella]
MDFGPILDDFNGFQILLASARWNTAIGGPGKKSGRNGRWAAAALLPATVGTQRPLECHHQQSQRLLGSGDGWGARFQLLTGRWDTAHGGFSKSIEISCPEVGFHPLYF